MTSVGMDRDMAIAVDLGGTNIRAALVTRDGTIRHHVSRPTLAKSGPEIVIDRIASLIGEVVAHEKPAQEIAVGVVAPGPLDPELGIIYFGPNLPGWHDIPLKEILTERLNRTILIGNDANCAVLGEVMFGAARDLSHVIYLSLGTGVGGGVVSHGQLIEGHRGFGGELGHISVSLDGPRCTCGGIGCIEAYAGGWAIARDGELLAHSERSNMFRDLAQNRPITAEHVAEAATAGDEQARAVFERAGLALAVGLGGLINVFNPEMIVIGGGLAEAGELLLGPMRQALPRYTMQSIYPTVRIQLSALGGDTGIYGAAARVFHAPPSSSHNKNAAA